MMRTAAALFALSLCLVGCDVPKSVGDEPVEDDAQSESESSTTSTTGDSATSTSGPPTASAGATTTPADTDSAGQVCASFDEGPYDGQGEFEWLCACQSCELSFPDVPPETIDMFEGSGGGLCECLCAQAGCGGLEGEGGVGTGAGTEWGGDTESGGDTEWGGSSTTDPTDTSAETSEGFPDTDSDGETGTPKD